MSDEASHIYVFKVDERHFTTTGIAIFAADTKEEARSMFYGLKWKDVRNASVSTDTDNDPFVDQKYIKILFHPPSTINRFMTTVWCLEYEFFLRVPVAKGLKTIAYSS